MAQIILLSGGMDSLISHRLFYPDAVPVFVRTGSCYTAHDYKKATEQDSSVRLLCLPNLHERSDGVVPHRNSILLSAVANMFGASEIVVSAPRGELIWDQQPAFHRAVEKVLRGVRILNPLRKLTKTQAVAEWLRRGNGWVELVQCSRSCYSDNAHQCGQCPACVKRWVALQNNGLSEFYHADVQQYARRIASMATARDLFRYGIRPTYEAWKAVNR